MPGTFVHVPQGPPPLSELLPLHSQFQHEQKLFPHQQVFLHLLRPIEGHKHLAGNQKETCPYLDKDM